MSKEMTTRALADQPAGITASAMIATNSAGEHFVATRKASWSSWSRLHDTSQFPACVHEIRGRFFVPAPALVTEIREWEPTAPAVGDIQPKEYVPAAEPVMRAAGSALSPRSLELFLAYANDAGNWSGTPLVGGNVGGSQADCGNLTQIKKAGLITTMRDEDGHAWVIFTDAGKARAAEYGVIL